MKLVNKKILTVVILSAAALVYFRTERNKDDAESVSIKKHQTPDAQTDSSHSVSAVTEIASHPVTTVEKSEERSTPVTKTEADEEGLQTANAIDDASDSAADDEVSRQTTTPAGAEQSLKNTLDNEMKFDSSKEKSDFLAKNVLESPDNWKQLRQLTASQIEETLKGRYRGVIRGDEINRNMQLNIDGAAVNGRFVGEMKLELTDQNGPRTTGGELTASLTHYVRASEENGVVSIVISGESERAFAFQLFFNKALPAEVIGNFYSRRNGHLAIAGEIMLQKTETSSVD